MKTAFPLLPRLRLPGNIKLNRTSGAYWRDAVRFNSKIFIQFVCCLLLFPATNFAQKITLTPAMLSYYEGKGNSSISLAPLADEQALVPKAISDNSATPRPASVWIPSWGATPVVLVDLGKPYALTAVALFDGWNSANLVVKYEQEGKWLNLFSWDMSYNERWKSMPVTVTASRLLFEFSDLNAQVGELALFGTEVSGGVAPPAERELLSAPTGLVYSGLSSTGVTLTWKAPAGNATAYEVYSDGRLLTSVTGTTATLSGLAPATAYRFTVRAKDAAATFSSFSSELLVTTPAASGSSGNGDQSSGPCTPAKLAISPTMIKNESGKGNATMLLDEQTLAGNPASGQGGAPTTTWFPGWQAADHPASAYIDFGAAVTIASVYLRDANDSGPFTISTGTPGNWKAVATDNLNGYNTWNEHSLNVTTRYLRFTRATPGANVSEVVIYGCTGQATPDKTAPAAITTLRAQAVSGNAIQLSWTATGNNGTTGTAAAYDIRYSTSPLTTETAFSGTTTATGAPAPGAPGTAQAFTVTGLAPATTYYFAIKVRDEAGNSSALSNTASATTTKTSNPTTTRIPVDQFIGINAFVDDPVERMQVAGFVREYHNWNWDEGNIWSGGGNTNYPGYPKNEIKWAPSEPGWNFDTFYAAAKAAGLVVSPVIQGSVNWLHGGTSFPFESKPIDEPGASTTNPNSYEKKAHHMFQFAARYGATQVADSKLTLAPDQPRKSGMGLIRYVEDWNEQDNNWNGPAANFSPEEYAAMASANYDGHANTMKQGSGTFGVKNADPNIKLVMGGIFELNLDYIKRMKAWFEKNRPDKKFAADVLNVHTYAWRNGEGPGGGGPAKSPEEDNFREKLKAFVDYRDQYLPGREVWISEFGWDTHPNSPLRVPDIAPFDKQEVQGQWIVRAYLAFAAAGVDRAMMYMLRDVDPNDATHFSTSGLVGPKGRWAPKKSWFYVYTLKNTLRNMVFIGEQASGNSNILIYKFKNVNGSDGAYVVWAKTKSNYTVENFRLSLSGSRASATKIEMVPGDTDGVSSALPVAGGTVTVNVSERPVFIKVDKIQ